MYLSRHCCEYSGVGIKLLYMLEKSIDDIDRKIIRILQENARISASDIGKKIHLSVSAVSERIRKMESSGLISKYTIILNNEFMQRDLSAFMLISLHSPDVSTKFLNFVEQNSDVTSCYYIAGEFDYMIKIVTQNTSTLTKVLNQIKNLDGVDKTNTMVVLETEKEFPSITV